MLFRSRKEAEDTLPRGTTAGQNRRTYRDPAVVEDEDSVFSQGDPPSGVKQQPSRTPSVKTMAMQADLPQRSPVTSRTDDLQQTKDESRKDHLQAPKEALGVPRSQQSTAQDKIYVIVQPMPAPGTVGTPYFTGQNVSQFIEQYERLCV